MRTPKGGKGRESGAEVKRLALDNLCNEMGGRSKRVSAGASYLLWLYKVKKVILVVFYFLLEAGS